MGNPKSAPSEEEGRETHTIEGVREEIKPTVTSYKQKLARNHLAKACKPFRFEMRSTEERERLIQMIEEEELIPWRDRQGVVIRCIRTTPAGLILAVATCDRMVKPKDMQDLLTKEFVNSVHRESDPQLVLQTYRDEKLFHTPHTFALPDGGIGTRADMTDSLREHHRLNAD
jgi:hypothetical protein